MHHHRRCTVQTGIVSEAPSLIEHADNARIHDTIMDVISIAARRDDPPIDQALQLIGNGLRLHRDGGGELRHAQAGFADQCVKQAKTCRVRQRLEGGLQTQRVWYGKKRALRHRGFWTTLGGPGAALGLRGNNR